MSSLIKGASPLDGAAAVRELTSDPVLRAIKNAPLGEPWTPEQRTELDRTMADIKAGRSRLVPGPSIPTTADVEHDGDRGPRAFRDPLSVLDQAADAARAQAVQRLMSAVAGLHVDEVRVLAAMARQLPGIKLRAACEAATALGWVHSGATRVEVPSSPLARAQSSLLGTWREWIALIHGAQSTAARDMAQRNRGDVLADEAARRAGGGE